MKPRKPKPTVSKQTEQQLQAFKVSASALFKSVQRDGELRADNLFRAISTAGSFIVNRKVEAPKLLAGVLPKDAHQHGDYIALDSDINRDLYSYANLTGCVSGFPGYSYLAQLQQRSEYREPSATIATEMTRKWITLQGSTEGDHGKRIEDLNLMLEDFNIRELIRQCIEKDGFFGRCQLYAAIKGAEGKKDEPLLLDKRAFEKNTLQYFKVVEPMWTTPRGYNTTDPTAPDFYKPRSWYMMGETVHASRMHTFISREVPDMLKPAYNFGGISLSQLIEPYVYQWLRTRDAISDLIHNFSVLCLATDLVAALQADESGGELYKRVQMFLNNRDNRGLMVLNKDTEELTQVAVPLSGLSDLQAQAQEHMSCPTHIPLVKLTGITPAGLNANSDGEIRVWYDYVVAQFVAHYLPGVQWVVNMLQINRWGDIDKGIKVVPEPLHEPTAVEAAAIRKSDAERDVSLISVGVITEDESRQRLSNDPTSGLSNLKGDAPGMPELETEGSSNGEASKSDK